LATVLSRERLELRISKGEASWAAIDSGGMVRSCRPFRRFYKESKYCIKDEAMDGYQVCDGRHRGVRSQMGNGADEVPQGEPNQMGESKKHWYKMTAKN